MKRISLILLSLLLILGAALPVLADDTVYDSEEIKFGEDFVIQKPVLDADQYEDAEDANEIMQEAVDAFIENYDTYGDLYDSMPYGDPWMEFHVMESEDLLSIYWDGIHIVEEEDVEEPYADSFNGSLWIDKAKGKLLDIEDVLEYFGLEDTLETAIQESMAKTMTDQFGPFYKMYETEGLIALNFDVLSDFLDSAWPELSLSPDGYPVAHLQIRIPADGIPPFIPFKLEPYAGQEEAPVNPLFTMLEQEYGVEAEAAFIIEIGSISDPDDIEALDKLTSRAGEATLAFDVPSPGLLYWLPEDLRYQAEDREFLVAKELYLVVPREQYATLSLLPEDDPDALDGLPRGYGNTYILALAKDLETNRLTLRLSDEVYDLTPEITGKGPVWPEEATDITDDINLDVDEIRVQDYLLWEFISSYGIDMDAGMEETTEEDVTDEEDVADEEEPGEDAPDEDETP